MFKNSVLVVRLVMISFGVSGIIVIVISFVIKSSIGLSLKNNWLDLCVSSDFCFISVKVVQVGLVRFRCLCMVYCLMMVSV